MVPTQPNIENTSKETKRLYKKEQWVELGEIQSAYNRPSSEPSCKRAVTLDIIYTEPPLRHRLLIAFKLKKKTWLALIGLIMTMNKNRRFRTGFKPVRAQSLQTDA